MGYVYANHGDLHMGNDEMQRIARIGEQYIPPERVGRFVSRFSRLTPIVQGVILGFVLLVTNTLGPSGVAPFIYFKF